MSTIWIDLYRTKVAKKWRAWELTRLPGYDYDAAFVAVKQMPSGYWKFRLDYDELDTLGPQADEFDDALDRVGPYPVDEIWERHKDNCSRKAKLFLGGWRWWIGTGLSPEMVDELRAACVQQYTKAKKLYATYFPSSKFPECRVPPRCRTEGGLR